MVFNERKIINEQDVLSHKEFYILIMLTTFNLDN